MSEDQGRDDHGLGGEGAAGHGPTGDGPGGAGLGGDGRREPEEVGSVAEEAAKLLGALQDWAKESGTGHAATAAATAATLAGGLRNVNEHIATGGADCRYCPVCRAIDLVRQTSPEVKTNLAVAANSLLQAASALLATQMPERPQTAPDQGVQGVQHIDLDDDPESWD